MNRLHLVPLFLAAAACGSGGTVTPTELSSVDVTVFAGSFVRDAEVQLVDVDDRTGDELRVVAGPVRSDASGKASLRPTSAITGLLQVKVTGGTYKNLLAPDVEVSLGAVQLSSFVPAYSGTTASQVAVTYWSSLADAAALAYARGKNPVWTTAQPVRSALGVTDRLLALHLDPVGGWSVRTTLPLALEGPEALRPVVFAALGDVALSRLALDMGHGIEAPMLAKALLEDLAEDGQLNGKGKGGGLSVNGVEITTETTRGQLAFALDRFLSSAANKTGLTRQGLIAAKVFDAMALDASLLYPEGTPPPPFTFETPARKLRVQVSAGAPVRGAQVQVWSIDPAAFLGTAETNGTGTAEIEFLTNATQVQVLSVGGRYADPTTEGSYLTLPTDLTLTAFVLDPTVTSTQVNFLTTLADAGGTAVWKGKHTETTAATLAASLALVDSALVRHFSATVPEWPLRSTAPATTLYGTPAFAEPLDAPSMVQVAHLALTAAARRRCAAASKAFGDACSPGHLVKALADDLADGQFNGVGAGPIQDPATVEADPKTHFSAETTRGELALALDRYVVSPQNVTTLTRPQLVAGAVYATAATDTNVVLYPSDIKPPEFKLEGVPPTVVLVSPSTMPTWVTKDPMTLDVRVTDNSGVGITKVLARFDTAAKLFEATRLDDRRWRFALGPLQPGLQNGVVWAEDATGASGEQARPLAIAIGFDNQPPDIRLASTPLSYQAEADLGLADGSVPPKYVYASASKVAVEPGTPIMKASSRLSWGPVPPTVETLGANATAGNPGTNVFNTPWLIVGTAKRVSSVSDEAPLVKFSCTLNAPGVPAPPPWEPLALAPDAEGPRYVVAIAQESLFPAGTNGKSEVSFQVSCTATDAAGQTTTTVLPAVYTYSIVRAPVFVQADPAWSTARADSRNIHAKRLNSGTYGTLWNGSPTRFSRWILENPSSVPIRVKAVSGVPNSNWISVTETRRGDSLRADVEGGISTTYNHKSIEQWGYLYSTCRTRRPCVQANNVAWAFEPNLLEPDEHSTIDAFLCAPAPAPASSLDIRTDTFKPSLAAVWYPFRAQPQDEPAHTAAQEAILVPAASGDAPGRVSLYVEASPERGTQGSAISELGSLGEFITPSTFWPTTFFDNPNGHQIVRWNDFWVPKTTAPSCTGNNLDLWGDFHRMRAFTVIQTATVRWTGTLELATDGTSFQLGYKPCQGLPSNGSADL